MAATNDGRPVQGGAAAPVYITNATGDPVPITGGGGGGAVTIADGADITQGAKADAAASTDAGTFSLIALFKRLLGKITAGLGVVPINSALFTGSAGSLNADILVDTDATIYRSVSIQLTGTWSGVISPQVSVDSSTSWNNMVGVNVQSNAQVINLTSNGIYAFSLPAGSRFRLRATAYTSGTANGTVIFSSTPMTYSTVTILPGNTIAVSATQLPAALAANGGLKIEGVASGVAVPVQATNGTLTDRSGTITTGGTRQQLAASNSSRKYFFFQNQSSGNLWLRFTGNATQDQSSMRVAPGDSWESPAGFVSTQAVDVVGATTGQAWHAVEA